MTTAIAENILSLERGEAMSTKPTLNAICLADMGDKGAVGLHSTKDEYVDISDNRG